MLDFTVLLSLYDKEKPSYLKDSLDSILHNTVTPNEIVVVLDGPINDQLLTVLNEYITKYPSLFNIVKLDENKGLGLALREGITHCSNELIARADTDDICRKDRFELQLKEFQQNPKLDICGSCIAEFIDNPNNIVSYRNVPKDNEAIRKYQRKRDAFNHMTVMYKKSAVLNAGNYQSCLLMEDSLLWANMLLNDSYAMNIDQNLVFARVGADMYARRGGLSYFRKYKIGRKHIYKTGYISWWDYISTIIIQFFVSIIPNGLRSFVFKHFLHK